MARVSSSRYVVTLVLLNALSFGVSARTSTAANFGPRQALCRGLFQARPVIVHTDPIEQLLLWEETANLAAYQKPTQPVQVAVVRESVAGFSLQTTTKRPQEIVDLFSRNGGLAVPQHPFNKSSEAPSYGKPAYEKWTARFSASRSLFLMNERLKGFYSIKLPTDHPHQREEEWGKQRMAGHIAVALERSQMIDEIDAKIDEDSELVVLRERLIVFDRETGNGISVRDLRPLRNGNYILPGFSIAFAGQRIAEHLGWPYADLWTKAMAIPLGRAKAKMLLRYGLQMETPNLQNFLFEFDRDLMPTGRVFVRDIGDTNFVLPVSFGPDAAEFGLQARMRRDIENGLNVFDKLELGWKSMKKLDESGIGPELKERWRVAHDQAYIGAILEALSPFMADEPTLSDSAGRFTKLIDLEQWLFFSRGRQLLSDYRLSLLSSNK